LGSSRPVDRDGGFTLIELLVVIIIIGILAAIAIPIYLNQRQKADSATVESDVRNAAEFEENYLDATGSYGSFANLAAYNQAVVVSAGNTLQLWYEGALGYCIEGYDANGPATTWWDSLAGGMQAAGTTTCPKVPAAVEAMGPQGAPVVYGGEVQGH
jgi:type IV pilus assembly protein PilA